MSVLDLVRRLMLSSLLLSIESSEYQIMTALCISILFVVIWRELGPYWDGSSDILAYVAGTVT